MKKIWARIFAIILTVGVIVTSFAGCSSRGKTVMELEGTELSVNMLQLFLSRKKGMLCSAYYFGEDALSDSFWDTLMSASGETYNDHFTEEVIDNAKTYLAALHLFEKEGLEFPKSTVEEIDSEIDRLIKEDADGSKTTFNTILSPFGVNYKILREAYILEAKIAYLNDYLFGSDGSKISSELIEEYYQSKYVRFKHVFIYTYALVYETDADGNDIYYSLTNGKKISYDTTKTLKKDENGDPVLDKNGDKIYVDDEGKVAYDKKNGKRSPVMDENGYQLTRKYTEKELIEASDYATQVMAKCEEGNYTLFDTMVENYSEDEGMSEYPNGYYLTRESDYDSPEVLEALFDMKEGEIRRVNSEYGIHVVMKYQLDEGGYANKDNSDFFVNSESGGYIFMSDLKNMLLTERLKPYIDKIVIDEKRIEGINMKSVGANFYY